MGLQTKLALLAVAGSGKTSFLVNALAPEKRNLLLTYTVNNTETLKGMISQKFSGIPEKTMVMTWFSFVFNFLVKPFRIDNAPSIRHLLFPKREELPPYYTGGCTRFVTSDGGLYHCRAFDFARRYIGEQKLVGRIRQFFDAIFIDEVQDFAGYDFDFIELIAKTDAEVTLAGDYFQHTFDTSRDGNKNQGLHKDLKNFLKRLASWYKIDDATLSESWRCTSKVCDFISSKMGIAMKSARQDIEVEPLLLSTPNEIAAMMADHSITKLFYDKSDTYKCAGECWNWGKCKGMSFDRVCVVLNPKTYSLFKKNLLSTLPAQTKHKLYVACSRTRGDLVFVSEGDIAEYKR